MIFGCQGRLNKPLLKTLRISHHKSLISSHSIFPFYIFIIINRFYYCSFKQYPFPSLLWTPAVFKVVLVNISLSLSLSHSRNCMLRKSFVVIRRGHTKYLPVHLLFTIINSWIMVDVYKCCLY